MRKKITAALIVFLNGVFVSGILAAPGISLNQARNGTSASPTTPVMWSNGNLNSSQAHYLEGMSAPYQTIMTDMTPGVQVSLTIGYDIRNSSKNAIDYLTHYDRMHPHAFGVHSAAESIDPLAGTGLPASTPSSTYTIPVPSTAGTLTPGQPAASYNALPAAERVMTMFNGTIDTIYYGTQGSLSANSSETRIIVVFTPSNATCVLAWGGHIGSRNDWGYTAGSPNSAGGISGSPFHMRLISWSLGSVGSQDRSLSGSTVSTPPLPLPVDMVYFSAHAKDGHNILEWGTASETDNDYFSVERSAGLSDFERLGIVDGAGTSSHVHDYSWTDHQPLAGISYYRLVQTDYDGKQKIYGPVSVLAGGKQLPLSEFKVLSSAHSGDIYISYYTSDNRPVQLDILSTSGSKVRTEILEPSEGTNFAGIHFDNPMSTGLYFVRLSQDGAVSKTEKFIR